MGKALSPLECNRPKRLWTHSTNSFLPMKETAAFNSWCECTYAEVITQTRQAAVLSHCRQKLPGHFKFSHWHALADSAWSNLGNAHEKHFAGRSRWWAARCGNFFHQHSWIRNMIFFCILLYWVTKLYNCLFWTLLNWHKHTHAN